MSDVCSYGYPITPGDPRCGSCQFAGKGPAPCRAVRRDDGTPDARKAAAEREHLEIYGDAPHPADQPPPDGGDTDAPNQATALVELARKNYRLLRDDDGEPWAVPVDGPNIAITMGRGGEFGAHMIRLFYEQEGKVPSDQAEKQAEKILRAYLYLQEPETVHLRVARHDDSVVLDLGTRDGRCAVITATGWHLAEKSPVPFRRGHCRPLPEPVRDPGGQEKLRALINANDDQFKLCVAWLVGALIPGIPHPVSMPRGEQGSAKTSMTRTLQAIIDPSDLEPGALPDTERDLAVCMSAAYVQAFDNVSHIPPWASDALCRAATGGAYRTRTLYTDRGVTVLRYIRPIILNMVDAGALNADLIERSAPMDLEKIPPEKRRPERAVIGADASKHPGIRDLLARDHPAILGWILDLVSAVLRNAPGITLAKYPRMADHGVVLAALDEEMGWDSLALYMALVENETGALLENSAFAMALVDYMSGHEGDWTATATEIRRTLTGRLPEKDKTPEGWPKDAPRAGVQLHRMAPTLRIHGIDADFDREGKQRTRTWIIRKLLSAASALSADSAEQGKQADSSDSAYCPPEKVTVCPADGNPPADGTADAKNQYADTLLSVPLPAETTPADGTDSKSGQTLNNGPAATVTPAPSATHSDHVPWPETPPPDDGDPWRTWPADSPGADANPPRQQPRHHTRAQRKGHRK